MTERRKNRLLIERDISNCITKSQNVELLKQEEQDKKFSIQIHTLHPHSPTHHFSLISMRLQNRVNKIYCLFSRVTMNFSGISDVVWERARVGMDGTLGEGRTNLRMNLIWYHRRAPQPAITVLWEKWKLRDWEAPMLCVFFGKYAKNRKTLKQQKQSQGEH